jgi:hypothetical protein
LPAWASVHEEVALITGTMNDLRGYEIDAVGGEVFGLA